jgi:capsular polysaccharide export protein
MRKIYLFGISRWKRRLLKPFFPNKKIIFIKVVKKQKEIIVWGNKNIKKNIKVINIEDGFIRSVSLGLDFSQPYSLIIDSRGIYFDATKESDLEYILQNQNFDKLLLDRAKRIQCYLVENKLSKYNIFDNLKIELPNIKSTQKTILVVGQVEGDASLIYGADNMKNIELLQQAREDNPHAYLVYKPHPDVLSGKREGDITSNRVLKYANHIEDRVGIDSLLEEVDEVATMTSLVGMEALLRGKKVTCYGMPFYAGWGLTVDKKKCTRRTKKLSLEELVAGVYILYPKYIDPKTLKPSEIESVIEFLAIEKEKYHNSWFYRSQVKIKNFIYIKYYAVLRHILKD